MYQQTSLLAYQGISNLSEKRHRVYGVISRGPVCNQEIALILNWPINCVTGRTRELVEKGMVRIHKKDIYPLTGKKVIFWEVVA